MHKQGSKELVLLLCFMILLSGFTRLSDTIDSSRCAISAFTAPTCLHGSNYGHKADLFPLEKWIYVCAVRVLMHLLFR